MIGSVLFASALAAPVVGAPNPVMPDRAWDFEHLKLDVHLDPRTPEVHGTATHVVTPLGVSASWLTLHQTDLQIHSVRVDTQPVRGWVLGSNDLKIPIPPGTGRRTIEIDYSAFPLNGLHFRGHGVDRATEVWSQGEDEDNRAWFPSWDYPNDRFTVEIAITAPNGYTALGTGAWIASEPSGAEETRWQYRIDRPIANYLVAVAVGDYDRYLEPGPVPYEVFIPRGRTDIDPAVVVRTTREAVEWLESVVGVPYEFPVYRQLVAQRFIYEAMENPGLTLIDADLWEEPPAEIPAWEDIVVHEAAHQWFGNRVSPYGWRELWLNEGFAEFYAAEWLRDHHGSDEQAARFRQVQRDMVEDPSPLSPRTWSRERAERPYGDVYNRGLLTLHSLRSYVGDDTFRRAVRRWVATMGDQLADTDQFRRVVEEEAGTHLGWFFDEFVHQGGYPTLNVQSRWSEGQLELEFRQGERPTVFPVDLEVGRETGSERHRVWLTPEHPRLILPSADPPRWVAIDPDCAAVAVIEHAQAPAAWRAQLERSPSACAALAAIEALGALPADEDTVQALAFAARRSGRGASFRLAAIEALGTIGEPAQAALWPIVERAPTAERIAAIHAAARLAPSEDRARTLRTLIRDDASAGVRAAALETLAVHAAEAALPTARRWVRNAASLEERRAGLRVLGAQGSPADLRFVETALEPGVPRTVRGVAVEALVEQVTRSPDDEALAQRAIQRLWSIFSEDDQQMTLFAVEQLAICGDEAVAERLIGVSASHRVPAVRDAARDAAAAIRSATR